MDFLMKMNNKTSRFLQGFEILLEEKHSDKLLAKKLSKEKDSKIEKAESKSRELLNENTVLESKLARYIQA